MLFMKALNTLLVLCLAASALMAGCATRQTPTATHTSFEPLRLTESEAGLPLINVAALDSLKSYAHESVLFPNGDMETKLASWGFEKGEGTLFGLEAKSFGKTTYSTSLTQVVEQYSTAKGARSAFDDAFETAKARKRAGESEFDLLLPAGEASFGLQFVDKSGSPGNNICIIMFTKSNYREALVESQTLTESETASPSNCNGVMGKAVFAASKIGG